MARDFDLYGWAVRLPRFGDVAVAQHTAESCSAEMTGRVAWYRWLRHNGFPEGFQILCLSCNDSRGTGERCTLAHTGGKKRRRACNEIKLPVKESGTDRTARDGQLALQDVRRRSQGNKEDR